MCMTQMNVADSVKKKNRFTCDLKNSVTQETRAHETLQGHTDITLIVR